MDANFKSSQINSLILRARCTILGNIPGTHIFESIHICKEAREYKHIKIIRYEESVYYVNVDNFKYKVIKLTGINPELVLRKIDADCDKLFKKLEKDVLKQKKMNKTNIYLQPDFALVGIFSVKLKQSIKIGKH